MAQGEDLKQFQDLGQVVAGVYTLVKGLNYGGFATVYLAEVNLDRFDWATVLAYRERRTGKTTDGLPVTRDEYLTRIEGRIDELRRPVLVDKVRRAVEHNSRVYPSSGMCAVKILDPRRFPADQRDETIERFESEWKNLMGICHPNVITVFGGGNTELNGRRVHYYAMNNLVGLVDPDHLIEKASLEEKLGILKKAALGLEEIHSHGLIHRDVKPGNFLVTAQGDVKVTDIGIAKDVMRDMTLTMTGSSIGTPWYMSPEQAEDMKQVDVRSDIYSLGAVLYEFLTGLPPFQDTCRDIFDIGLALRQRKRPTPILKRNPDVPQSVVEVAEKMMHPNPDHRYDTMQHVLGDLEALIRSERTSIQTDKEERLKNRESAAVLRAVQVKKQRKNIGIIAGAVAAGIIILLVGAYLLSDKDGQISAPASPDQPIVWNRPVTGQPDQPPPETPPIAPVPVSAPTPATTVPPSAETGWQPIFDGRTLSCLSEAGAGGWKVENGALTNVPEEKEAAKVRDYFRQGEIRVSFEVSAASLLFFRLLRRGGLCGVTFGRPEIDRLTGQRHTLVFDCNGPAAVVRLDGKPLDVYREGPPASEGQLHFKANDGTLRVFSIDFRPLLPGAHFVVEKPTQFPSAPAQVPPADEVLVSWDFENVAPCWDTKLGRVIALPDGNHVLEALPMQNKNEWYAKRLYASNYTVKPPKVFVVPEEMRFEFDYYLTGASGTGALDLCLFGWNSKYYNYIAYFKNPVQGRWSHASAGLSDFHPTVATAPRLSAGNPILEIYVQSGPTDANITLMIDNVRVVRGGRAFPPEAVIFKDKRYLLYPNSMTWEAARRFCEEQGGHLITITSKEEGEFVKDLARANRACVWIGLTDEEKEGEWRWVTGEPLEYLDWATGEPNNSGGKEHWAMLSDRTDYCWNDEDKSYPFICEWETDDARREPGVDKPGAVSAPEIRPHLDEFDTLIDRGEFREAHERMKEAAGDNPDVAGELAAAARVAEVLEERREIIRSTLTARKGREVTLETAKGKHTGEVQRVSDDGIDITLLLRDRITKRVIGEIPMTIPWSDLTETEEARLAVEWKPEGDNGQIARAYLFFSRGDIENAKGAIERAPDHPLADHLCQRIGASAPETPAPTTSKPAAAPAEPGWQTIFNGRDLSGWVKGGSGKVYVQAGAIVCTDLADALFAADWEEYELSCDIRGEGLDEGEPFVRFGLANTSKDYVSRNSSRVNVYFYGEGDVHAYGAPRPPGQSRPLLVKSGCGKAPVDNWLSVRLVLTKTDLSVYADGKTVLRADLSGVPAYGGGVLLSSERGYTMQARNIRVRSLSTTADEQ